MKLQFAAWVLLHGSVALANPLRQQAAKPEVESAAKPEVESAALQALITEDSLQRHAAAFQGIATANGGNRALARPGYDASVQYVKDQMAQLDGMKTWTQDFEVSLGIKWVGKLDLDGAPVQAFGIYYTPATPEGGLTAPLVLGPSGAAACGAAGYANLDVRGKIVVVERGNCPGYSAGYLERRMMPAASAGAAGVAIYSDSSINAGGFSRRAQRGDVPTVLLSRSTGADLVRRLGAGERLTGTLTAGQYDDLRPTQNVFVETTGGDASQTLILGAHLDSVEDGPGINDNASGCSLLLEVARALSRFRTPRYRVRFAFWAAEEKGMLGSTHYVDGLGAADARAVMAYLNFDMVGRGFFGVFDGDGSEFGVAAPPGSAAIEDLLADAFAAAGRVVTPAPMTNRTDYVAFFRAGRPVGGLTSGPAEDNCNHRACDTLANVDAATMAAHAKAAAHALSVLAVQGLDS